MKIFIKKLLVKIIPLEIIQLIKRWFGKKKYYCPVCSNKIYKFKPLYDYYFENFLKYKYIHSVFNSETFNLLSFYCPKCGTSDKERFYALFLTDYFKNKELKVLDIAPSSSITNFINTFKNIKYRTADLYMKDVDDKVDITNMDIYSDGSYDFVICSHVLEHIVNDLQAMSEIYRILSKTGKGIIMVPIYLGIENDYELNKPMTEAERWQHYGQDDHVRTYSKKGFMNKLQSVGFEIEEITIKNYTKEIFDKYGIHERSVLYIVSKN